MSLTTFSTLRFPDKAAWITKPTLSSDKYTVTIPANCSVATLATFLTTNGKAYDSSAGAINKWYFEVKADNCPDPMLGSAYSMLIGYGDWDVAAATLNAQSYIGSNTSNWAGFSSGNYYLGNDYASSTANYRFGKGDVMGVMLELVSATQYNVSFKINGATLIKAYPHFTDLTTYLTAHNGVKKAYPFVGLSVPAANAVPVQATINFGAKPFKYDPPTGYSPFDNPGFVYKLSNDDLYICGAAGWTKIGNGEVTQTHINAAVAAQWCIASQDSIMNLIRTTGTSSVKLYSGLAPEYGVFDKAITAGSSYSTFSVDFSTYSLVNRMEVI